MMRKLAIASLLVAGVALSGSVFAQAAASSAPAAATTAHKAHAHMGHKTHKGHKKMTTKEAAAPASASTAG